MDGYSRLVAFLKVILPLSALALLSTLFLISRGGSPTATLPFGDAEISERLREGVITGPYYSGTTSDGQRVVITAKSAKPGGDGQMAQALDIRAQVALRGGGLIVMKAQTGSFDPEQDLARFEGDVLFETTTGYALRTSALQSKIKSLDGQSDGPVTGQAPFGALEAGQMLLRSTGASQDAHLLFKDGVKLIYDPKLVKDTP